MRTSETITKLAAALAKAQAKISDPTMSGLGQMGGKTTTARKYPYALLTDVLAVARVALGDQGIFLIQAVDIDRNVMLTRLVHSSGEWLETDYPMAPRSADPQKQGSANTYARRYALMTILGIAGERDDDGEGAKGGKSKTELDSDKVFKNGTNAGRAWFVKEFMRKAVESYSGGSFSHKLSAAKVLYHLDDIKIYCLWLGRNKPSRMKPGDRDTLVDFLASDKGRESWVKFVKECGPLKVRKKRPPAKKKTEDAEPEGDKGWTRTQAEDFKKKLRLLDFKPEEVTRWCLATDRPHPSTMSEERRANMLVWLEKEVKVEGEEGTRSGSDQVVAWLYENPLGAQGAPDDATPDEPSTGEE